MLPWFRSCAHIEVCEQACSAPPGVVVDVTEGNVASVDLEGAGSVNVEVANDEGGASPSTAPMLMSGMKPDDRFFLGMRKG